MDVPATAPERVESVQPIQFVTEFRGARFRLVRGKPDLLNTGVIAVRGVPRRYLLVHPPAALGFQIPCCEGTVTFGAALHPDVVGKAETGPCAFIVRLGRREVARVVVDPRAPDGKAWREVEIALPATAGMTRELIFETAGIDGMSYRWALIGEPTFRPAGAAPDRPIRAGLERTEHEYLATHRENLAFNLYRELMYWNNCLIQGDNPYINERVDPIGMGRTACPEFLISLIDSETARLGRKVRILDFGAGPFSTLIYLHKAELADVTVWDALSSEYATLLESHGIDWPLIPEQRVGEYLLDDGATQPFDIVFVSNALDHTQAPALTWMNLFALTQVGGILAQRHVIREATHEQYDQLHQFDLFPGDADDGSLWIADGGEHEFSLTRSLDLACIDHREFILAGRPWFESAYRKTGTGAGDAEQLSHVIRQLKSALKRRSGWAFTMEDALNSSIDLRDRFNGLPYYVERDRA